MNLEIEDLVKSHVAQELDGMDLKGIIVAEVRCMVREGVGKKIVSQISATANSIIEEEVIAALGAAVRTDDGWGKKEAYRSFEDLFRATLKKAMEQKYEIQKLIATKVTERVNSLMKQDYNAVIEKMVDEISKSRLVPKS